MKAASAHGGAFYKLRAVLENLLLFVLLRELFRHVLGGHAHGAWSDQGTYQFTGFSTLAIFNHYR